MPSRMIPGFCTSIRTLAVRILGSRIEPRLLTLPLNTRPGYALRMISAESRSRTLARSFSYTSQRIQTVERSEIVNGLGELSACTADALVTCWSVITPDTGATTSTIPMGLCGSLPSRREMLFCGFEINLGLVLRILGYLQIVHRDGAMLEQVGSTFQLGARQDFIRHGLAVVGKAAGHIVASYRQQQLALLHDVTQSGVNGHDAPGSERDHRNVARDIGSNCPRDDQLGGRGMRARRHQRELLRVVDLEEVEVDVGHDVGRRRSFRRGISTSITAENRQRQEHGNEKKTDFQTSAFHKEIHLRNDRPSSPLRKRGGRLPRGEVAPLPASGGRPRFRLGARETCGTCTKR